MKPNSSAKKRFRSKFKKDEFGCWIWTAAIQRGTGYGRFGIGGKNVVCAHRAAWAIFKGKIQKGLHVLHKCDVRACVNPSHLFLGTPKDNMADCSRKGRIRIPKASYASDESHQVSKLKNKQVIRIRTCGESAASLAKEFGVSVRTIYSVKARKTYRDVRR